MHMDTNDQKKYEAVLFDLDGTINDSGPGIMESVRYAIERSGYPPLPDETLRRFVGPSLLSSFSRYCHMPEDVGWKAVEYYRELYLAGELYNLKVYPDMPLLLEALGKSPMKTAVVSSKPYAAVEQVLEHYDMRRLFDCVTGPAPDDPSNDKAVLIRSALKKLSVPAGKAVMVGDTRFDIIGAHNAGTDSIGVTYGYGTVEELRENDATYLAGSVREIAAILGLSLPA